MIINEYTILFLAVLIGGSLGFMTKGVSKTNLNYFLAFSAAYILGITALELLPTTFDGTNSKIGIWLLVGFLIQLILEYVSGGVEHGHMHSHSHKTGYAIQVLFGLSLHALIEGLPLTSSHELMHDHDHHIFDNHYLVAIIMHKTPAAFVLVSLFVLNGYKKSLIWICLLIFSIMTPLGGYIGHIIQPNPALIKIFMAIVIGSFLHISTTILFESDTSGHHHNLPWKKLIFIIAGLTMAGLLVH